MQCRGMRRNSIIARLPCNPQGRGQRTWRQRHFHSATPTTVPSQKTCHAAWRGTATLAMVGEGGERRSAGPPIGVHSHGPLPEAEETNGWALINGLLWSRRDPERKET